MARPDLSIIIVSFNSVELTLSCLRHLHEHPAAVSHEIIVLDNASADGSPEAIEGEFPNVCLLRSPENLGFGAGVNRAAASASGRRLLLLNPDTFVLEGAIDHLWSFAERQPWRGLWGGRTLFPDGRLNPASCWGRISLWSLFCGSIGLSSLLRGSPLFNPEGYGGWCRDSERAVDIVTGCFLMIDAELWKRLEGFDPLFFMYAEEADLCLRAARAGASPAITDRAEAVHLGGGSTASKEQEIVGLTKGRLTLIRKHWPRHLFRIGWLLTVAGIWARSQLLHLAPAPSRGARPNWQCVWQRRAEWMSGYTSPGSAIP